MTTEYCVGESITVSADDLTLATGGPVTSGATVTFTIADDLSRLIESSAVAITPESGDDWTATLTAPLIPGVYTLKAEAEVDGVIWRQTQDITVLPF